MQLLANYVQVASTTYESTRKIIYTGIVGTGVNKRLSHFASRMDSCDAVHSTLLQTPKIH